jgi:mono/diheme cytochrome c family protein
VRILIIPVLTAVLVLAQTAGSVWDGVYSEAQASKGQAAYGTECVSCHGEDLLGSGPFPALTGDDFRKEWDGQTVGDLFERMRISMPATKPGSLSGEQNAAILAFILKSNGYPAGKADMKGEAKPLSGIRFVKK